DKDVYYHAGASYIAPCICLGYSSHLIRRICRQPSFPPKLLPRIGVHSHAPYPTYSKMLSVLLEFDSHESLRQDVGRHFAGRTMHDFDLLLLHHVVDEVVSNVNVFGAVM